MSAREPEVFPNDFKRQWRVIGQAVLAATEPVGASLVADHPFLTRDELSAVIPACNSWSK